MPSPYPAYRSARLPVPPAKPRIDPLNRPFETAEAAWMWTMAALRARREGGRSSPSHGVVGRPCEPDDVIRCLDDLYRRRMIDLAHARVLRVWGERQMTPNAGTATEACDAGLWRQALERMDWPLRAKGIVA